MIPLTLQSSRAEPLRILCLGAHADDIEIGCGGLLLALLASIEAAVHWVVFSGDDVRADEAQRSAQRFAGNNAALEVEVHRFRDGLFPHELPAIKAVFEAIKRRSRPDLILAHVASDSHQDHRVIAELSANTFRDHLLLGYEIPKYDGDLGRPNLYAHLSADVARRKAGAICDGFPSQRHRPWFSPDTFLALARLRGIECNAPEGYAEGFYAPKAVLGF
jgi:LmbE family N-acetylglucosaminyl deacetylase